MDIDEFLKEYENNETFKAEVIDYFEGGPGMSDLEERE